jgi:hypothetical protein
MHPRISVTDSDAYNYIQGAYSFQAGHGYKNLNGETLNIEPPGYSLLLSRFGSPLRAAFAINYFSLALAAGLVYLLAENAGWSSLASAGLALVLGVGFFRDLAKFAKPDILNYAIFLLGVRCVADNSARLRTVGGCLWAFLAPLKLVSVVFVPAMIASDCLLLSERRPLSSARYAIIVVIWVCAVAGIFVFNYLTIGAMLVPVINAGLPHRLISGFGKFGFFFFRAFLANWYGSIRQWEAYVPFCLVLIIALICLSTLRPYRCGRRYMYLGGAIFGLTWLLLIVSHFDTDPRIMAYGLLVMLLALRPIAGAQRYWLAYACATVLLALANSLTTNSLGANDPRYAMLGREIASVSLPRAEIVSNSEHLLDLQARVPTEPVHRLADVPAGALLMRINLQSFDAISVSTWPIEEPPTDWTVIARWPDAALYRKPAVEPPPTGHLAPATLPESPR